jgi:hypothetical protein
VNNFGSEFTVILGEYFAVVAQLGGRSRVRIEQAEPCVHEQQMRIHEIKAKRPADRWPSNVVFRFTEFPRGVLLNSVLEIQVFESKD